MKKSNLLLPYGCKLWGYVLSVPSFILGSIAIIQDWEPEFFNWKVPQLFPSGQLGLRGQNDPLFAWIENNVFADLLGFVFIVGALMVGFSKEKMEDEMVQHTRSQALVWATWVNFITLAISMLLVYDMAFFWVMIYSMFTLLIFFNLRFRFMLWKQKNALSHEK